ncbi:MAG: hypothetical protein ACLQDV_03600 [Candidatus Binataceae bacterium]
MTRRGRSLLIFNGALLMLLAMSAGIPGFPLAIHKEWLNPVRQYFRQAHSILMVTGIWLLVTGLVLPSLELTDRWILTVTWSLILSGYSFLAALVVLAIGFMLNPPIYLIQWDQLVTTPYHLGGVYTALVSVSGLTSFIGGLCIVMGSYKMIRRSTLDMIH